MNLLVVVLCALATFFICGIPFGLIFAKRSSEHVDVRTVGSGNIGMTNVARSAGFSAAALTFLFDVLKGTLCVVLSRLIFTWTFPCTWEQTGPWNEYALATGLIFMAAVLGHVFSPYLGFKGGKGISTGFGAAVGVWPPFGLSMIAVFFVLVIPTRYVSLGSIAAVVSLPVFSIIFGFNLEAFVPYAIAAAVILYKHKDNMVKLIRGEERRFTVHKKDDK